MSDDHESSVVDLASELISRPSENPPGDEAAVAEFLAARLKDSSAPFDVETREVEPGRPNVVARAGDPSRGSVLLTGHTDVVPANAADWTGDPYDLREADGRVVGRGIADMKGALAAKVLAAESYLTSTEDPGEVVLAFVVDEEDQGRGTQALIADGIEADAAIVGEPTELDVCVAIKGVARYEVTVEGESCHSGQPDEGIDAIRGLARVIERIEEMDDRLEAETSHAHLAPEDVTVTEVEGGIAPNVVADRATAIVDWRFLPGPTDPETFDERLADALDGISVGGKPVDVTVDRTVFARGAEVDDDHPLVEAVVDAAESAGVDARPTGFNAATDARFLINDANVPTVHFGPGSIHDDAHTVDESVTTADLAATVRTYRNAFDTLLE